VKKSKWRGQYLLNKVWLGFFLVGYVAFLYLANQAKIPEAPEGYVIPPKVVEEALKAQELFAVFFNYYLWFGMLLALATLSIRIKMLQKYSGIWLGKGRANLGRGRTENFRWPMADMYLWSEATNYQKEKVEKREKLQDELNSDNEKETLEESEEDKENEEA